MNVSKVVKGIGIAKEAIELVNEVKDHADEYGPAVKKTVQEVVPGTQAATAIVTNPNSVKWPVDTTGRSIPLKEAIRGLGNIQSERQQAVVEAVFDLGKAWFIARCERNRAEKRRKADLRDQRIHEENVAQARFKVTQQEEQMKELRAQAAALKAKLDESRALLEGTE